MTEKTAALLWMVASGSAFAVMGAVAHHLSQEGDWGVVTMARTGVALALLVPIALASRVRFVWATPPELWVRSVEGTLAVLCSFYAYARLPASYVLAVQNLSPLWIAVFSWLFLAEAIRPWQWLCVAGGIAGATLILQPGGEATPVALVAVASSAFLAVAVLGLHRLRDVDPVAVVVHFSLVAFLGATGYAVVFRQVDWASCTRLGTHLPCLLLLGAAGAVGQYCLTLAYTRGAPTEVAVVGLTQVGVSGAVDLLVFRYQPTWVMGVGLALLLASTALTFRKAGSRGACDSPPSFPPSFTHTPPGLPLPGGGDPRRRG